MLDNITKNVTIKYNKEITNDGMDFNSSNGVANDSYVCSSIIKGFKPIRRGVKCYLGLAR